MKESVQVIGVLNLVAFTALAIVAVRHWTSRRDPAAAWAALSFGALGVVVLLARAVPAHPHSLLAKAVQRLDIAVLLVFPYLLYRFARSFRRPNLRLAKALAAMTALLVVWTFALPRIPGEGEHEPLWFVAYLAAFLVHWTVLSVVVAAQLWRAGSRQPSVARRRMRHLSFAAAAITVALILTATTTDPDAPVKLASAILAFVSAVAFYLGLAPPGAIRMIWRRPEQDRVQDAIADLVTLAMTQEEIAARVLAPMADIVGARAVELRNEHARVVGSYGDTDGSEPLELDLPVGSLRVWTTPYAPFFGDEELALLRTVGALTGLAFDRVRLFEQEHAARVALEQADQLKTNFVALAAHELRTPVTTIYGFVQTLNRRADTLPRDRVVQLREALEQQTLRMASLVEQLLDLSRLDAAAIEIAPQTFSVRERLEQIVRDAAGARAGDVQVDVDGSLEATVDPDAFDRIVSNLVTNAFRYGEAPVIVRAEQSDRHFRVSVEDRGRGVEPQFVPELFDRFSRSEGSRAAAVGTGLGLAIARSYARAHDGDLLYEDASPHGARFQLVLPAGRTAA
jgi:signal transduction histidine kinase